ncbi:unnamed protein product [Symbiodinium natans]|uniref:Uncharacterized protein n=1 Tax=Symbiodinium natans TaxID=878477 RepID=A0A812IEC9_9DINO|nr:unnamed protein product [Symbiodinium natans]
MPLAGRPSPRSITEILWPASSFAAKMMAWANMHRTRATRAAATAREFMASGDGRSLATSRC